MNSPAIDIENIILLAEAGNIMNEIRKLVFPISPKLLSWDDLNLKPNKENSGQTLALIDLTSCAIPLSEEQQKHLKNLASEVKAVILFHADEKMRSLLSDLQSAIETDVYSALGIEDLICMMASFNFDSLSNWYDFPYLEEEKLSEMHCANFRFKTLEEANILCDLISNQCPDPPLTSIGLLELMINAVEHGNLEISYEEKSELLKEGQWQAEVKRRLTLQKYQDRIALLSFVRKPHRIEVTVTVEGSGFNAEKYLNPDKNTNSESNGSQYHGRGIAVASQLDFEKIEYFGVGNQVRVSIQTN